MINKIILENEIVLYWDRASEIQENYAYCICYDDKTAYTKKTHFTIKNLPAESKVKIAVSLVDENHRVIKEYERETVYLPKPKKRIDVTKAPYFAVGDGKTMNTVALQKAFDECKNERIVYFPKGVYLTGALDLHDDTELYFEKGATLQGTENPNDYLPKIWSRFEGVEGWSYRSLLNAGKLDSQGGYNCKNLIIRGEGAILGGGKALMENTILQEGSHTNSWEKSAEDRRAWRSRGRLLNISNCQNVILYGMELGMGASWNIHMVYSDNIVTTGCYIHSEEVCNGDGWDPDSSTNCTIFNCEFKTRDDMVAIKSGKNPEGNQIARPSENIRVFDCRSSMGHGIAIGSEMSGGVSDVFIWDCDISTSRCGLEIKGTTKRGGYVRNVRVDNCKSSIIAIRAVTYNNDGEGASAPPVFENCVFENVEVSGIFTLHTGERRACAPIIVHGFSREYPAKNIRFKNVKIKRFETNDFQNVEVRFVEGLVFENIVCE